MLMQTRLHLKPLPAEADYLGASRSEPLPDLTEHRLAVLVGAEGVEAQARR